MRISKRIVCWGLLIFLAASGPLQAQGRGPQELQQSCRIFVQAFMTGMSGGI